MIQILFTRPCHLEINFITRFFVMSDCYLCSLGVCRDLICRAETGESAGTTHVTTGSTEIQLRPAGAGTHLTGSVLTQHGLCSDHSVPGHQSECQSLLSPASPRITGMDAFLRIRGKKINANWRSDHSLAGWLAVVSRIKLSEFWQKE